MLTDGQIDPKSYVIVEIICDKHDLFVELLLENKVQVSHVIVYSGNCDKCNNNSFFVCLYMYMFIHLRKIRSTQELFSRNSKDVMWN